MNIYYTKEQPPTKDDTDSYNRVLASLGGQFHGWETVSIKEVCKHPAVYPRWSHSPDWFRHGYNRQEKPTLESEERL